jgi:hypothetical protein
LEYTPQWRPIRGQRNKESNNVGASFWSRPNIDPGEVEGAHDAKWISDNLNNPQSQPLGSMYVVKKMAEIGRKTYHCSSAAGGRQRSSPVHSQSG